MRISILLIVIIIIFCNCNVNTKSSIPINNSSHWTFKGIIYKPDTTYFRDGGLYSETYSSEKYISISFYKRPSMNRTYSLCSNSNLDTLNSTNCTIWVHDVESGIGGYLSIGKNTDTVYVTLSNKKLKASFTNISIISPDSTSAIEKVSGTLVER